MLVSLTAADLLRSLTWSVFLLISVWVVAQAFRRPTPANIDMGLLFGGLGLAIIVNALVQAGVLAGTPLINSLIAAALIAMPFQLVRLMDDVVGVPPRLMHGFMAAFVLYIALVLLAPPALIAALAFPLVLGLLITLGYVVVAGLYGVRRTRGITRRRLIAVSSGSLFLALNFGAGSLPLNPQDTRSLVDVFGVAAAVCYYFGFAPPRWLRQLWQGPEVRAFLARSAGLLPIEDAERMLRAVEQGVAAALGAPHASIALWDQSRQLLTFPTTDTRFTLSADGDLPAAQAFRLQAPLFSRNTRYDPALDSQYRLRATARVVLSAPITSGAQRLGVLSVYGPRVSLFADDDLALLQLLADQVAVVLESRRLGERAARIRAREEAARLKEDFLSTAAHDLKTPLTTLVVQAQLLERRARRQPEAPADQVGLRRIVAESERLRAMVLALLDAAQPEQALLVGTPEPLDLAARLREVAARHQGGRINFVVEAPERLVGTFDPRRIEQVLENLADNAVTYSPRGGTVTARLWEDEQGVHLTVADQGIGIPADDAPHLFERFHRGANVDDRRFPGWGLGLSTSRRIVEQYGGKITFSSKEGVGTTFHVTLPVSPPEQVAYVGAHSDH